MNKDSIEVNLSSIEEIVEDARNGKMYILIDDPDRENEGDLIIPAQYASPQTINFMAKHGRGLICLALTKQRIEELELPSIYFTHEREVFSKNNLLVPVTEYTQPPSDVTVKKRNVRFRTVGDISCTCPVLSSAKNPEEIIMETASSSLSERGATRLDDQTNEASMERRKKEGYF